MINFADRLRELLNERGLEQKQFYTEMNYSKNQIHYWLKEKANPSLEQLKEIAKYFEVSTDYLLGLTDIPDPY